jgi:GGDEF domain-containing protein
MEEFRLKYGLPVGVSFGIYSATRGASAEQILDSADRAMYARKHSERGREAKPDCLNTRHIAS